MACTLVRPSHPQTPVLWGLKAQPHPGAASGSARSWEGREAVGLVFSRRPEPVPATTCHASRVTQGVTPGITRRIGLTNCFAPTRTFPKGKLTSVLGSEPLKRGWWCLNLGF